MITGALVAGLTIFGAPVGAAPPDPEVDESFEAAVSFYAAEEGVDKSDASEILTDQRIVNEAAFGENSTEIGNGRVSFEPEGDGQKIFVRSLDDQYVSMITSTEISEHSEFIVEKVEPLSEDELAVSDETLEQLRAAIPNVQGVWIRESDGALMVDAEGATDAVARRSAEAVNVDGYDTVIISYGDKASDTITVRGGAAMSVCTSGVSAKYGSYIGVITAAHCPNSMRLYGKPSKSGSSTAATMRKKVHNKNADIAFYSVSKSGNTWSNTRFASSASRAVKTGGGVDIGTGTTACRRGMTQGWKCGKITSIAFKPAWSGACPGTTCASVFVRYATGTASGDSGAPVTAGSSVIGIHKGGSSSFSVYSKLYRMPSGVTAAGVKGTS
ncbi:MAG: hypothetical protein Q4G40_08355 [Brachybacterium sp.]|nr:hypothetical protein [Brachybacterium sp.]